MTSLEHKVWQIDEWLKTCESLLSQHEDHFVKIFKKLGMVREWRNPKK